MQEIQTILGPFEFPGLRFMTITVVAGSPADFLLVRWMDLRYLISSLARLHLQHRVMLYRVDLRIWEALAGFSPLLTTIH